MPNIKCSSNISTRKSFLLKIKLPNLPQSKNFHNSQKFPRTMSAPFSMSENTQDWAWQYLFHYWKSEATSFFIVKVWYALPREKNQQRVGVLYCVEQRECIFDPICPSPKHCSGFTQDTSYQWPPVSSKLI